MAAANKATNSIFPAVSSQVALIHLLVIVHFPSSKRPTTVNCSWRQHDLDAPILFVSEGLIKSWAVLQLCAVRDDVARIDLALLDPPQQVLRVAIYVCLPCPDREPLVHGGPERHLV